MLELKGVFIFFVSSSEAVIKIFPTTLSLAFVYDIVGVGFFYKTFSTIFSTTPMFHKCYKWTHCSTENILITC